MMHYTKSKYIFLCFQFHALCWGETLLSLREFKLNIDLMLIHRGTMISWIASINGFGVSG